MKRILIYIRMNKHDEYDIFSEYSANDFLRVSTELFQGGCPNVGNRLWFQGVISAISTPENQLTYWNPSMTKDYINDNFDIVIHPLANAFAKYYNEQLQVMAERFRGIRIPVYIIACGIQAKSYDHLDDLCNVLKDSATAFISSVYDTGGEFALRGYFTKEFFERLGFPSAVATGCPSMYQLGRNLHISDEKVPEEEFRPLLNGNLQSYTNILRKYPKAEFFHQDSFLHDLWDSNKFGYDISDKNHIKNLIKKYGLPTTLSLLQDKIKLIPNMNDWREYIIREKFSMSYGSRIHGNIMPILAGIPAVLDAQDARTREMAEFFNIPCASPSVIDESDLYSLYQKTSYRAFNETFAKRFDAFESFLRQHGIVEHINQKNPFFTPISGEIVTSTTKERRDELYKNYKKHASSYKIYSHSLALNRKISHLMHK